MSHTPGPWKVGDWEDAAASIDASRWEELAVVYGNETGEEPFVSEGIANARLIAAAPDLLAALITAHAHCGCQYGDCRSCVAAQAAIEKAGVKLD